MDCRWICLAATLVVGACFNPSSVDDETDGGTSTGGPTGADDDGGPGSGGTGPTTDPATSSAATSEPTGGPDDTTGGPPPSCGDGTVDRGEECDEGTNNGPGGACLEGCVLNVCGDGDLGPTEACDDGPGNALEIGACAPDCSTVIDTREISVQGAIATGAFGPNPVAAADAQCPVGTKAMFAVPGVRQATTVPNDSVDAMDWVLAPYTAYVRPDGTLIWITDAVPLLGVRGGAPTPLVNAIIEPCPAGITCIGNTTVTGMQPNWITPAPFDCNGWTNGTTGAQASWADEDSPTDFLMAGTVDCQFQPPGVFNGAAQFYCVQQ